MSKQTKKRTKAGPVSSLSVIAGSALSSSELRIVRAALKAYENEQREMWSGLDPALGDNAKLIAASLKNARATKRLLARRFSSQNTNVQP